MDQCSNCTYTGDWELCSTKGSDCKKDDWIVRHLTAQLAEANQKKETSATNARYYAEKCCQLETQLAERDAEIQVLRQIATVHKCVMDNTHIAEDEHIEKIAQLTKQLTASQQEVERLKAEVQSLQCPSYCAREADARKQAAREIVEMLRSDKWAESELKDIIEKFGLEG